jgi:hypothetical protein
MEKLQKSRRKPEKPRPIARKRFNFFYLLLSILFAITTIYLFLNFPPSYKISIYKFSMPIIPVFMASLATFIFCIFTFIFKRKTQGIIFAVFTIVYLIIRLLGLTHWIFLVLILALFITTELFILKKK